MPEVEPDYLDSSKIGTGIELDPETRLERSDEVSRSHGFRAYVKRLYDGDIPCEPENRRIVEFLHAEVGQIGSGSLPITYDFKTFAKVIEERAPSTEQADLFTALARVEAEWRAERQAREGANKRLGVHDPTNRLNQLSWKNPQPDRSCGFINRRGHACTEVAVPGSPRCVKHGGMLVDPETRQAFLLSAYAAIVDGADAAVEALVYVATKGKNELARVQAAKEILDRAGLTATLNINLKVGGADELVSDLQERLDAIQRNVSRRALDVGSSEQETIIEQPEQPEPEPDSV